MRRLTAAAPIAAAMGCLCPFTGTSTFAFNVRSSSSFHGERFSTTPPPNGRPARRNNGGGAAGTLTMRKQKASDKRTRRSQRGASSARREADDASSSLLLSSSGVVPPFGAGLTASPMSGAVWKRKSTTADRARSSNANGDGTTTRNSFPKKKESGGGRGRSRKRAALYDSLASYRNEFLHLLTSEYRVEEAEVLGRIHSSDPLNLEASGYALFDLYPERRGDIFSDEVYRLVKAYDATTTTMDDGGGGGSSTRHLLPSNHKFGTNDVVVLTLQPNGSGDFFGASTLPATEDAISAEARVLNAGPAYVDVAMPGGTFEAAFGIAPNDMSGRGDRAMRLRVDRFFSDVPYRRMVSALSQMTSLPEKRRKKDEVAGGASKADGLDATSEAADRYDSICMDELLREVILSTYGLHDASSGPSYNNDRENCDLGGLAKRLAKPPFANSVRLANQALGYIQANPTGIFPTFNGPQLSAVGAALTRRLTLIQGPPGTGKTTVGASIAFGFVHQCRTISPPHAKVLACAFSNVGADNLAERLLRLGLKVVRVGKASGVSPSLWEVTLDAAIDRDPGAQKALGDAAKATANVKRSVFGRSKKKGGNSSSKSDAALARNRRDAATMAVKASIKACNVAATKAIREADVIISTSVGSADPRLLAACGIETDLDDEMEQSGRPQKPQARRSELRGDGEPQDDRSVSHRGNAPDGLPPLSLPFVIVDEACQSVEPANLIPLVSTNSCRSLVLLGDPCQLPPTVRSDLSGTGSSSPLSVSLMSRLASILPHPVIITAKADDTERENSFLNSLATKQAASLVRYRSKEQQSHVSYRKQFSGSLLLSVQYRMHPSIAAFSSAIFYDGLLSTPSFLAQNRRFPAALDTLLPIEASSVGVRFVNVGGRNNEQRGESSPMSSAPFLTGPFADLTSTSTSYRNEAEASQIVSLLKDILKNHDSGQASPTSIGIVTPYAAQVALIKSLLAGDEQFRSQARGFPSTIEVMSVDAYQGRERDLIIFSAVRSNRSKKMGFLTDWRRMNVALTRAKSGLVVVGDLEALKAGDKHWEAFGNWCEGIGCVHGTEGTTKSS